MSRAHVGETAFPGLGSMTGKHRRALVSGTDKGLCAFPNGPGPSSLENSYISSLVLQAIFLPTAPFPEGRDLSDQCNLTHGTLFTFSPLMGLNV